MSKKSPATKLTHIGREGRASMVDVSRKPVTFRRAVATGRVLLGTAAAEAIRRNTVAKGNVLETARIGAIQAAKRTSELIPLCHPIPISNIELDFELDADQLVIRAQVSADAKTGVEMEALTAVSAAALIVYDMCKAISKAIVIGPIELLEKEGGKSGYYRKDRK